MKYGSNAPQRRKKSAAQNVKRGSRKMRLGGVLGALAWSCGTALFLVGLSWGLLAGYRYLTVHPYFSLQQLRIEGNERLDQETVLQLAGINTGDNSLAVDMGRAKTRLMRNPWIKDVLIRRILPDTLQIHIQEREAVFWVQHENRLFFADRRGEPIAPVTKEQFVSLPLLELDPEKDHRGTVAAFADRLQQQRLPFSAAEVDWVRFASDFVLEAQLRDSGPRIVLEIRDLARHCRKLLAVWRDLRTRQELAEASALVFFQDKAWVRF